jgi:hypothetical protein
LLLAGQVYKQKLLEVPEMLPLQLMVPLPCTKVLQTKAEMLQRQMHRAKLPWGRRQPKPGKSSWQGPSQQQRKGRQHGTARSQSTSSWHLLYRNVFRSMTAMAHTCVSQAMQGVA